MLVLEVLVSVTTVISQNLDLPHCKACWEVQPTMSSGRQAVGTQHHLCHTDTWHSSGTVLGIAAFLKSQAHIGVNGRSVWPGTAFQFIERLSCNQCSWRRMTLKQACSAVRSFPSTHVFTQRVRFLELVFPLFLNHVKLIVLAMSPALKRGWKSILI